MRNHKSFERVEGIKSARLVVIAAEGKDTENIYFEAMKNQLCASNVQLEVKRRDDNNSSPQNVFNQINMCKDKYDISEDDELWVVVDRDHWPADTLQAIADKCEQDHNLNFCLSNPCFELWLLLHIEDVEKMSDDEKVALRQNRKKTRNSDTWLTHRLRERVGHYNKAKYNPMEYIPYINTAIQRAKKLDNAPQDPWPQDIGTRVYLLAISIMGGKQEEGSTINKYIEQHT